MDSTPKPGAWAAASGADASSSFDASGPQCQALFLAPGSSAKPSLQQRRLALSMLALLATGATAGGPTPKPYDEQADARADLNQALQQARLQGKKVLVVFGANWCADCQALAKLMAQGSLAEHVAQRYVVSKVDVGNFNKNLELSRQLGDATKKGIPALAVLGSDGGFIRATQAGELANARALGEAQVLAVLDTLAAAPAR